MLCSIGSSFSNRCKIYLCKLSPATSIHNLFINQINLYSKVHATHDTQRSLNQSLKSCSPRHFPPNHIQEFNSNSFFFVFFFFFPKIKTQGNVHSCRRSS